MIAAWGDTANVLRRVDMLRRVADFTRTGKKVLVVAATHRHAGTMRRELHSAGADMALLEFTTPRSLHMVEGLRVDRVEIDEYARIVARQLHCADELEYIERTVTW